MATWVEKPKPCPCGSGMDSETQYDGRGIPLIRTCDKCHTKKMARYRPEILKPYTQADVAEPIEPEAEVGYGRVPYGAFDEGGDY